MGNGNDSAFRMNASSRELAGKPQDLKRLMTALHQFWDIVMSKAERQITKICQPFSYVSILFVDFKSNSKDKNKGKRLTFNPPGVAQLFLIPNPFHSLNISENLDIGKSSSQSLVQRRKFSFDLAPLCKCC